jgi:hypothetical protein
MSGSVRSRPSTLGTTKTATMTVRTSHRNSLYRKRGHTVNRFAAALREVVRLFPKRPYPSDHPWREHHDPTRPRG